MTATSSPPLTLKHAFFNLRDPRCVSRVTYPLIDLIFIAVCALITGASDYEQIAIFARQRRDFLRKHCPHLDTTHLSADTFERLFRRLNILHFARSFTQWMKTWVAPLGFTHIAIDGKSLCGSARGDLKALQLISAWATDNKICLAQYRVDADSNEITAIPKLLEMLDLRGALVTIDAIGCQKAIAKQIVEQGGDFLLRVKKNQASLYRQIRRLFHAAAATEFEIVQPDIHVQLADAHGRLEQRTTMTLYPKTLDYFGPEWTGIRTIGWYFSERQVNGKTSIEEMFLISSRHLTAPEMGAATRQHWGIENQLHWQLDVTFREDNSQIHHENATQCFALIRRLALNLLYQAKDKISIKNLQYNCAMSDECLEKVLGTG